MISVIPQLGLKSTLARSQILCNLILQDQKRTVNKHNDTEHTIIYSIKDLQYNNSRCIAEEDLFPEVDYINQHFKSDE